MQLKIDEKGYITDEFGNVKGALTDSAGPEIARIIELSSDAIPALEHLYDSLRSRDFRRKHAIEFIDKIIKKHGS